MDTVQHISHLLIEGWWYVTAHRTAIGAVMLGSFSLSAIFQILKKKLHLDKIDTFKLFKIVRMDAARYVGLLFTVFTAIGTLANYVLQANAQNIGVLKAYPWIVLLAFPIHNFIVSPGYKKIAAWVAGTPYFGAVTQLKASKAASQAPVPPDPTTTFES